MNNLLYKLCHYVLLNDLFIFIIRSFFLHKDASPDQTLQIEQKAVDQREADHQAMISSNRPTNMHFQRKSDPMVDPDEESLKQNTE